MVTKTHRFIRILPALGTCLLALLAPDSSCLAQGQTLREVVFTDYGTESSNAELIRRLVSPLGAVRLQQDLKQSGKTLALQPLNLGDERFTVFLPTRRPARGFGLLVFVPPWQDARVPPGWEAVLERQGMLFVSAARSGNEAATFARREPLALLAAHNIKKLYPIDPDRIYIGGFSGGSRIALRLALGYPDLFRGVILNAGSAPIGNTDIPLPPQELLLQFQEATHVIYVTGERDADQLADDTWSIRSLHQWCVFQVDDDVEPREGHAVMAPVFLASALNMLAKRRSADPSTLSKCRTSIKASLDTKVQEARSLVQGGRRLEADKLLTAIDQQFGGLAASINDLLSK